MIVQNYIGKYLVCSIPIKKLDGTITLPSGLMNTSNIKVWGHTPGHEWKYK